MSALPSAAATRGGRRGPAGAAGRSSRAVRTEKKGGGPTETTGKIRYEYVCAYSFGLCAGDEREKIHRNGG